MHKLVYFLAIVLMLSMASIGVYIWQNEQDKNALQAQLAASPIPTTPIDYAPNPTQPESAPTATSSIELLENSGTITGAVSFPSETIPPMEICAEHIITHLSKVYCTTELLSGTGGTGVTYQLLVPPGTYHVYAKLPNDAYKAYYNEFVTCGLQASCPSHEPIDVEVQAGDIVTGIDPQDWYNQ